MSIVLPATAPDADGTLRKVPFANLIVYLRDRGLTGTVVFDHERALAAMSVRRGTPYKARTDHRHAWLSSVTFDLGLGDRDRLGETWELARDTRRLHGQVLIEYGILDREKLLRVLAAQLERKIAGLANLPADTRFRFYQGKDLLAGYGGVEEPDVPATRLVWVSVREAPPWAHIERSLAKLETTRLALSRRADLTSWKLGADEERVIHALQREPLGLGDLATRRLLEPSHLTALVYALLVTKQLELHRAEGAAEGSTSGLSNVSQVFTPTGGPVSSRPAVAMLSITPEQAAFRAEIARRKQELGSQNHFELLGISADATRARVNEAFFELAKRWHPDKLAPEMADLRSDVSAVFSRLAEAHRTLTDDGKRADYVRLVQDGGATLDDQAHIRAVVDGATELQKAEILLKRRDFAAALEHAERALALDPHSAEHIALVAHLRSLRTDDSVQLAGCLADLDRAVSKSPRSARSLYYRALLHKKMGKTYEAMNDFRGVVEIDPDHVDAAREVRLQAMRTSKPEAAGDEPPKPGGFFGKLFKR